MKYGQLAQRESHQEELKRPGHCKRTIIAFIKNNPGCSRREIMVGTGLEINVVTARVKLLLDNGAVREIGISECKYTGRNVARLAIAPDQERFYE